MESNNSQEDQGQKMVEENAENNFENVTVKPSDEMKEKKINYTVMGEDVAIDPEATVFHYKPLKTN